MFTQELNYKENLKNNTSNKSKNRKRKNICFNPRFCKLSNINIGNFFLNLIDKHFNNNNPSKKIFNRKTLRISHSCVNNVENIIDSHNSILFIVMNRKGITLLVNLGLKMNALLEEYACQKMWFMKPLSSQRKI